MLMHMLKPSESLAQATSSYRAYVKFLLSCLLHPPDDCLCYRPPATKNVRRSSGSLVRVVLFGEAGGWGVGADERHEPHQAACSATTSAAAAATTTTTTTTTAKPRHYLGEPPEDGVPLLPGGKRPSVPRVGASASRRPKRAEAYLKNTVDDIDPALP